ncbi:tRNA-guanine transglycosylase [Backusella circina FSU 941]|nr:tRNA-guanine transglycosylase [Backusella circina FSU 941]
MTDSINDLDAGNRRIRKSVDRSLRWLDECLHELNNKDIAVFATVMGHTNELERTRSAIETSKRNIQGFIIHLNGLKNEQLTRQIRASIDHLAHDKPRLAYGLSTPEGILHGISNGIDMFDGSYAFKLTENGRAIMFKFGDEYSENTKDGKRSLNLWDSSFGQDFEPLDPSCGCSACSRPHSRAYIHHLLTAYEMLASALLMSHNIYQLDQFMTSIRNSIKEGRFEQDKYMFLQHYSHDSENDGKVKHMDELDTESLGIPVKKKRAVF